MNEEAPGLQKNEEFPLLKMTVEPNHEGCRFATPKTFSKRFPECVPVCWLALSLVTISLIGLLTLGSAVNKRESVLVKLYDRYHQDRQHRIGELPVDVFYHKIIHDNIAFDRYTAYLADMALKYPFLKFHVIFLIDDNYQNNYMRHYESKLFNKMLKHKPKRVLRSIDAVAFQLEASSFMQIYPNVNLSTQLLTDHLNSSPMHYRWRRLSFPMLQFYSGVNAVWKNGGIALDLDTFNDDYNKQLKPDRRIRTVFHKHNEGLAVTKADMDMKVECSHEDGDQSFAMDIFSAFSSFMNKTETRGKEKDLPAAHKSDATLIRKHRSKREADSESKSQVSAQEVNLEPSTMKTNSANSFTETNAASLTTENAPIDKSFVKIFPIPSEGTKIKLEDLKFEKDIGSPSMILFDISFSETENDISPIAQLPPFSPGLMFKHTPQRFGILNSPALSGSSFSVQNAPPFFPLLPKNMVETTNEEHGNGKLIVLDVEGRFISTSARYNPFLGRILFQSFYYQTSRSAYESILTSNCYGPFGEASFCGDVYFL